MNSVTFRPRLKKDLWSKFRLGPKIRTYGSRNPESQPKNTADPRSTVFLKSANPLDSPQKSTICVIFKPNPSIWRPIHPPLWDKRNFPKLKKITKWQQNRTRPLWSKILKFWQCPWVKFFTDFVLVWRLRFRLFLRRQMCLVVALRVKWSVKF